MFRVFAALPKVFCVFVHLVRDLRDRMRRNRQQIFPGDLGTRAGVVVTVEVTFGQIAQIRDLHRLVAVQDRTERHNAAKSHIDRLINVDRIFQAVFPAEDLFDKEMRRIKITSGVSRVFGDLFRGNTRLRIVMLPRALAKFFAFFIYIFITVSGASKRPDSIIPFVP